jgi:serine/threonine protein kinase
MFTKEQVYSESKRQTVVKQILLALSYLETEQIVHRDLKPDNIVYCEGSDNVCVKLIDFGFAKNSINKNLDDVVGTPYFIAPEIINKQKYGTSVDIWSLGVLTYLICTG